LGNAQCSLDLLVLTIGIHFGGGIESWGLFEPVAVLVVAGLVLSERDSVFQASSPAVAGGRRARG